MTSQPDPTSRNRLAALLTPDHVLVEREASSRRRVFDAAAQAFERLHGLPRSDVSDALFTRERLGSTGLGLGVAIPHARLNQLKRPLAVVLRTHHPVDVEAADDEPVRLFVFLLVPQAAAQQHLALLAEVAELLSDRDQREALMQAPDALALYDRVSRWSPATR